MSPYTGKKLYLVASFCKTMTLVRLCRLPTLYYGALCSSPPAEVVMQYGENQTLLRCWYSTFATNVDNRTLIPSNYLQNILQSNSEPASSSNWRTAITIRAEPCTLNHLQKSLCRTARTLTY